MIRIIRTRTHSRPEFFEFVSWEAIRKYFDLSPYVVEDMQEEGSHQVSFDETLWVVFELEGQELWRRPDA